MELRLRTASQSGLGVATVHERRAVPRQTPQKQALNRSPAGIWGETFCKLSRNLVGASLVDLPPIHNAKRPLPSNFGAKLRCASGYNLCGGWQATRGHSSGKLFGRADVRR